MIVIPQMKSNDMSDHQLIPGIKRMQEELKKVPKAQLIQNSGMTEENGRLFMDVFFQRCEIDPGTFEIVDAAGNPLYVMLKSIVLTYLTMSDGILPSGHWISFRELPNGGNYCHAFQGYAPDSLSNHFKEEIHRLDQVCLKLGGNPIDLADLSFEFNVFPRINIVIAYYLGEDSFPTRASLLFDAHVPHYMVTAGLASIGHHLVDIIIKTSYLGK